MIIQGEDFAMAMTGIRARLGVIVSANNQTVEPQLRHTMPAGLELHVTRMHLSTGTKRAILTVRDEVIAAARLLAAAKVDVIILQASYLAMMAGPEGEAELMQTVCDTTGTPALSSPQAMVEAAKALRLQRLVVVTPWDAEINAHERAYLTQVGFDVIDDAGLGLIGSDATLAVTPQQWVEFALSHAHDSADGYFISGSNTHSFEAVARMEDSLRKPVLTSVQTTLWAGYRRVADKTGLLSFPSALGQLFHCQ